MWLYAAAIANKSYGLCSRAFIKLESLEDITDDQRNSYEALALQLFTKVFKIFLQPELNLLGNGGLGGGGGVIALCSDLRTAQNRPTSDDTVAFKSVLDRRGETKPKLSVVSGKPVTDLEYWICKCKA